MFLERIRQPGDLRTLDHDQLRDLSGEIRDSKTVSGLNRW